MSRRPKPEPDFATPPDGVVSFAMPGAAKGEEAVSEPEDELAGALDLAAEGETVSASLQRGSEVIKSYLRDAPTGPGVYRMISAEGEVLYVGKAKSVKKRIASYARDGGHNGRIARMISLTSSMVFVSTATETESLLL